MNNQETQTCPECKGTKRVPLRRFKITTQMPTTGAHALYHKGAPCPKCATAK